MEEFRLRKHHAYPNGYRNAQCWECEKEFCRGSAKKYRDDNIELCRQRDRDRWPGRRPYEQARDSYLKRVYGISLEEFDQMLIAQGGYCAICDKLMGPPGTGKDSACLDHDHATGATRFILCRECNIGLGNFADSIKSLQGAVSYLSLFNP